METMRQLRRRGGGRAAANRYGPLIGYPGIVIVSVRKLVAIRTCSDPSDPSAEVTLTSPNVHTLNVQSAQRRPTPRKDASVRL